MKTLFDYIFGYFVLYFFAAGFFYALVDFVRPCIAYAQRVVVILPEQSRPRGTYDLTKIALQGWQGVGITLSLPNDPALLVSLKVQVSRGDCANWVPIPFADLNFTGGPRPSRPWGVSFPKSFVGDICIGGTIGQTKIGVIGATFTAHKPPP